MIKKFINWLLARDLGDLHEEGSDKNEKGPVLYKTFDEWQEVSDSLMENQFIKDEAEIQRLYDLVAEEYVHNHGYRIITRKKEDNCFFLEHCDESDAIPHWAIIRTFCPDKEEDDDREYTLNCALEAFHYLTADI